MKSNLNILSILFFCFIALSCSEDDDQDNTSTPSTIYNETSFVEISSLNGSNVTTTSFTDGVTNGSNTINASPFGSTNLTGFNTGIAAPTDDSVTINASLNDAAIVLTSGTEVPPFFADGDIGNIIDAGDGVLRLDIKYNFTYPADANPIPINTIDRIRVVYSLEYLSSGSIIHTKTFTHTIFFN